MPTEIEIRPRHARSFKKDAKKRNESFEEMGWTEKQDSYGVDPRLRNFVGLMGEFGFASYADLGIDSSTYPTTDGGADFTVRIDGERLDIDVKTTQKEPHALWVKEGRLNADWYVLGHLRHPEEPEELEWPFDAEQRGWGIDLYGMATKQDLENAEMIESDYGHMNHSVLVEDLRALPDPDDIEQIGI